MYYIEKYGAYGQGVMWIGEDLEEAKSLADKMSSHPLDDGHHTYAVYKLLPPSEPEKDAARRDKDWKCNSELVHTGNVATEQP